MHTIDSETANTQYIHHGVTVLKEGQQLVTATSLSMALIESLTAETATSCGVHTVPAVIAAEAFGWKSLESTT